MNPRQDPHAIAEMFADMADMFSDAVDHDGLSMLLSYCLEVSGNGNGAVVLLGEGQNADTIVGVSGRVEAAAFTLPNTAVRALRTLQTEVSITQSSSGPTHEYAFPLRIRGTALGLILLTGDCGHPLNERDLSLLQSIADIAATTIDQTHRLQQTRALVSQLQGALDSRVVIEQAKGILAAQNQTDVSRAFNEIRSIARREQRPVRVVASEIVSSVTNGADALGVSVAEN